MKFKIFFLFLIVFLLSSAPIFTRILNQNSTLPGTDPYFYALQSKNQLFSADPYSLLVSIFSLFFGMEMASRILPFILTFISFGLLYFSLNIIFSSVLSNFISFTFLLSPFFISLSSFSSQKSFLFFLLSFLFFCLVKRHSFLIFVSVFLMSILNFSSSLFCFLIMLLLYFYLEDKKYLYLWIYSLLMLIFYHLPFTYDQLFFYFNPVLSEVFIDFGAEKGFSSFIFILGMIGIFACWSIYKKYLIIYLFSFLIILLSFFNSEFVLFANVVLIFFAGYASYLIYKRSWEVDFIKTASLLVIFCGIFFTSLSFIITISSMNPDEQMKKGLLWLGDLDLSDSFILSHPKNSLWIEYFSSNPVLLKYDDKKSEKLFNEFMSINDLLALKNLLKKHSVSFIVITKDIYEAGDADKGLFFLLKDSETFKSVYSNGYLEIWEVIVINK